MDAVPDVAQLERWAVAAIDPTERESTELVVRLVEESESQALNATYRGKDRPTNVLSFAFEPPPGLPPEAGVKNLGDIVICAPVVKAEAEAQRKTSEAHWAHMVVHGVLHLLGYDHQNDTDAADMESRERDILAALGYPDPYMTDRNL